MAQNSLTYYINKQPKSLSGISAYYNYGISGSYLNNTTGISGLNGGVFYQNYNSSESGMLSLIHI